MDMHIKQLYIPFFYVVIPLNQDQSMVRDHLLLQEDFKKKDTVKHTL